MAQVPIYCDDWECPCKWTCAKFWGRSKEYWAFDVNAKVETRKFYRNPNLTSCMDYRQDQPREWLQGIWDKR